MSPAPLQRPGLAITITVRCTMTGNNDNAPTPDDKGASGEQGFLDALERLGQLPIEQQEPMPALPARLLPMSGLDLLEPNDAAFARWVVDRLCSGDLIAYGRPSAGKGHRIQAIPTSDWPSLVLKWSTAQAEQEIAQ